jgi:hypothetical protein
MIVAALLLTGLAVLGLNSIDWDAPITPFVALKLVGILVLLWQAWGCVSIWWRLRQGLDQWPDPGGPYYKKWMALSSKDCNDDYYLWLAKQKRFMEPWRTWAQMEAEQAKWKV